MISDCLHPCSQLMRVVIRDGRTQVVEWCPDCKSNIRGSGVWVPRSETGDVARLPLLRDMRSAEDRGEQRTLFPGGAS